jgi:hypothetical protein
MSTSPSLNSMTHPSAANEKSPPWTGPLPRCTHTCLGLGIGLRLGLGLRFGLEMHVYQNGGCRVAVRVGPRVKIAPNSASAHLLNHEADTMLGQPCPQVSKPNCSKVMHKWCKMGLVNCLKVFVDLLIAHLVPRTWRMRRHRTAVRVDVQTHG